jgi:hypothetical protein
MKKRMNVAQLFEMLGIEEVVVADDVKFLQHTPPEQLRQFEQVPVLHHPRCAVRGKDVLRCRCTATTRVRVKATA